MFFYLTNFARFVRALQLSFFFFLSFISNVTSVATLTLKKEAQKCKFDNNTSRCFLTISCKMSNAMFDYLLEILHSLFSEVQEFETQAYCQLYGVKRISPILHGGIFLHFDTISVFCDKFLQKKFLF